MCLTGIVSCSSSVEVVSPEMNQSIHLRAVSQKGLIRTESHNFFLLRCCIVQGTRRPRQQPFQLFPPLTGYAGVLIFIFAARQFSSLAQLTTLPEDDLIEVFTTSVLKKFPCYFFYFYYRAVNFIIHVYAFTLSFHYNDVERCSRSSVSAF